MNPDTNDELCTCGHSVYGHGFFEGDARAGTEEFVIGCTEDDCECRSYRRPGLTVTKAAEESGIPRETIIFAINRGWLKAHKTGIHTAPWQIERPDFADWLAWRKEQAQLEAQRWESK